MNEKTNDMDARFEQFYAANFPRVKNFARLLTKSEEDAEDIAQNIFLKLWTGVYDRLSLYSYPK